MKFYNLVVSFQMLKILFSSTTPFTVVYHLIYFLFLFKIILFVSFYDSYFVGNWTEEEYILR